MAKREPVARVSFSLNPKLLEDFDHAFQSMGFEERSKALQRVIRSFISESEVSKDSETQVTGTIVVLYDHEIKGIDEMLTDIGHEFAKLIISSLHAHLEGTNCLSVIVIRGQVSKIRELEKRLRSLSGVSQLKFAYLPVGRQRLS